MITKILQFLFFIVVVVSVNLVATQKLIEKELNQRQLEMEIKKDEWQTNLKHQQEIWLSALEWCESRGVLNALNPIDSNGKPSFGAFQFQIETFLEYGKKYKILPVAMTEIEAKTAIFDYKTQKIIVYRMLQDGLASHWKACYRWINEPYPQN